MRRISISAAIALCVGLGSTGAQAAAQQCVTSDEASELMLVLAPEAIKAAGTLCAGTLPSTALLRQTNSPLLARYQAEADAAWPQARSAIGKIGGLDANGLGDSDLMRPLLTAMVLPAITGELKPKDCPAVDHIVTLLAPLPPRNAAELVVAFMQLGSADETGRNEKRAFPICPAARP
jgi:hypothetical protein